jgi:hypothetical protein
MVSAGDIYHKHSIFGRISPTKFFGPILMWIWNGNKLICTLIARQYVGKQIPIKTDSLVNSPLLGYVTIEESVFSVPAVKSQQ